jgi:hypothetical protein
MADDSKISLLMTHLPLELSKGRCGVGRKKREGTEGGVPVLYSLAAAGEE